MTDSGWKDPGTMANADRDGKDAWSDVDNAKTSDNNDASIDIPKNDYSDWLRASNFGFTIPSGATIDGIEVKIERAGETNDINDSSVRLHVSGTPSGDDKATATDWPGSDAEVSYGDSADDWSAGYDDTDINDSGFGVQISAYNDDDYAPRLATVDHIQIQVSYTEGGGPTPTYSGRGVGRGIIRGVIR